jgi:flagellar protein FliS
MPADAARARYLADTVATASPARRIVMLYDRLWLDIQRAQIAADAAAAAGLTLDPAAREHLFHAQQIVAELLGSLDVAAWPDGAGLASLYGYLLSELIAEAGQARPGRLAVLGKIVSDLRSTWQQAEEKLTTDAPAVARVG